MSTPAALSTALSSLVGGRCYPDMAPETAALPFIVYRQTAQAPVRTLDGKVHAHLDTYSIDIWAETRGGAESLHPQVRTAMNNSPLDATFQGLVWGADVEMGFEGCSLEYLIIDHAP